MKNNFYCKNSHINIYEKPSYKSKISSQIIYGEKFRVIYSKKNWLKVKTIFDNYIGFIKKRNFPIKFNPKLKISVLKARIFNHPKNQEKYKTNHLLTFGSKIEILKIKDNFVMIEKNKWILKKETKKINYKNKNYIKILKMFLGCKYKWGGKNFSGIDCSAILQNFFYYNNKSYPRDTKDQINFYKKKETKNPFKKGNIIFWKGHVAICINSNLLIHAYGPEKKVLIMPIQKTIERIEKTANLKVKKIVKIIQ